MLPGGNAGGPARSKSVSRRGHIDREPAATTGQIAPGAAEYKRSICKHGIGAGMPEGDMIEVSGPIGHLQCIRSITRQLCSRLRCRQTFCCPAIICGDMVRLEIAATNDGYRVQEFIPAYN